MIDGEDVRRAARSCRDLLRRGTDGAWDGPVPDLDMPVRALVAHIAQCCIWYAVDLTASGRPLEVVTPTVACDGAVPELIDAVDVCAALLAQSVDGASVDARGFHPFGHADPIGFAAMGCDEILVHTADVAGAWGLEWVGDEALATRVVERLFPWAPPGGDPWETLMWCNGRRTLGHYDRLHRWRWHCAPLSEWDGSPPSFVTAADGRLGDAG